MLKSVKYGFNIKAPITLNTIADNTTEKTLLKKDIFKTIFASIIETI